MNPALDAATALQPHYDTSPGAAHGTALFASDLPVFRGYFPQHPVVPGVYQLALFVALARRALAQSTVQAIAIDRCKWIFPLAPGQLLSVDIRWHQLPDSIELHGRLSCQQRLACSARLLLR